MAAMRVPEVNYGEFRPDLIHTDQYKHLKLLLFWPVYALGFILLENFVNGEQCHVIHCPLDDRIPFCEWFLIPYVFWYFCLFGISVYTLLYDVSVFRKFMKYLMLTTGAAFVVYILYPSRQELRPQIFFRENVLTAVVKTLYHVDTNTNVFPSLHVMHAFAILSAGLRAKGLEQDVWKWFFGITTVLVCLSTVFLKQHSILDGVFALPVCAGAEWLCYGGKTWVNSLRRKTV